MSMLASTEIEKFWMATYGKWKHTRGFGRRGPVGNAQEALCDVSLS
jgi:hypothetical protein